MGADMIGFLSKGPVKFTDAQKEAALAEGSRILSLVREWHDLELAENPDADAIKAFLEANPVLKRNFQSDIIFAERLVDSNVNDVLAEFIEVWENGARDVASRIDPDNENMQLWFAGGMSWGDEPDGYGYQSYQDALLLGMTEKLGIY
jgi:hypothetical protein